ncbi:MAG: MFS transporter [Polyangiaceae bacterium]
MRPRVLLFITVFNSILGLSVLFPVLPPLGRTLGLSELQVGSLSTSYALMQFLLSPTWGRRSEKVGRKPVLLLGILGFSASFFLFSIVAHYGLSGALAPGAIYGGLLLARLFGGAFSSATLPTAQAYIADTTERDDRTAGMGLIGAAFGLGVVFGPALGAGLSRISLLTPVYFSAGFALVNALFVWLKLPEPQRHVAHTEARRSGALTRRLLPLLLVGFGLSLSSVAMEQTIAFYYQDRLGLTAQETARSVGLALVFYGLVAVFAQGYIVRRGGLSPIALLRIGVPVALVGFVALIFAHQYSFLTSALAIQGLGQGLAMPGVSAAVSLAVGDSEQGAAAGLSSSSHALGRMLGPVVGTSLYQLKPEYPYWFSAGLLVVLLLGLGLLTRSFGHTSKAA